MRHSTFLIEPRNNQQNKNKNKNKQYLGQITIESNKMVLVRTAVWADYMDSANILPHLYWLNKADGTEQVND